MIADELRQAAQRIRDLARAADHGPWEVGPTFGAKDTRVYVRQEGSLIDSVGTCVFAAQVSNMPNCRGNAAHIALWHPGVAVLVAAELEQRARPLDTIDANMQKWLMGDRDGATLDPMLALARAINGVAPVSESIGGAGGVLTSEKLAAARDRLGRSRSRGEADV